MTVGLLAASSPAAPSEPPTYRWIFADLLTDRTLWATPDLQVTSFSRWITPHGQAGVINGNIAITSRAVADRVRTFIDGAPCVLYPERSAGERRDLWGAYLVTVGEPAGDEKGQVTCTLRGTEIHDYANRRLILADLTYANTDQLDIVRDLWDSMAAEPAGDIGLELDATTSATARDRTYLASDMAEVGKRIGELCEVRGGPEIASGAYYDTAGVRHRVLRIADQLGDPSATHLFARPGRVLSWSWPSQVGATRFVARGAEPESDQAEQQQPQLSAVVRADTYIDAGWPLLDHGEDRPGVKDPATLDAYAIAAATKAGRTGTPSLTVDLATSSFDPSRLGDTVTVKLDDAWWDNASMRLRIVGMDVRPTSKSNPREMVTLFPVVEEAAS